MIRMFLRTYIFLFTTISISACGVVYNPQKLPASQSSEKQQEMSLEIVALTSSVAAEANNTPFVRRLVVGSNLDGAAELIDERSFINFNPPPASSPPEYRVGVGDVLQFARLMPRTDEYSLRLLPVTSEGYVSVVEVGRIDVLGKNISEIESSISASMLRSGVDPRFEVSISGFNSQKIFFGGDIPANVISFTDKPITIGEALTTSGVSFVPGKDKLVKIFRDKFEYRISANEILTSNKLPNYYLHGGDRIFVENLFYRSESVILTGEVGSQSVYNISAQSRPTLSDALFNRGAISQFTSDSSHIYLIRRVKDKSFAYHLDGSNPARLALAYEIELRPQDIIFVAEQPITRFNRVLQQLLGVAQLYNNLNMQNNESDENNSDDTSIP
jgi:polysaccharide biosynthesis/export protein